MVHGHGGGEHHGVVEGNNKTIAILISVLALSLAIAETLGKSAQTEGLSSNIETSDFWAFNWAEMNPRRRNKKSFFIAGIVIIEPIVFIL